jgi:hypothetical protein
MTKNRLAGGKIVLFSLKQLFCSQVNISALGITNIEYSEGNTLSNKGEDCLCLF